MLDELKKDFDEAIAEIDFNHYDPYSKAFMKALFIGEMYMIMKCIDDDVEDELDGAREYMIRYMVTKDSQFKEMAKDELKHAGILIRKEMPTANTEKVNRLHRYEEDIAELSRALSEV